MSWSKVTDHRPFHALRYCLQDTDTGVRRNAFRALIKQRYAISRLNLPEVTAELVIKGIHADPVCLLAESILKLLSHFGAENIRSIWTIVQSLSERPNAEKVSSPDYQSMIDCIKRVLIKSESAGSFKEVADFYLQALHTNTEYNARINILKSFARFLIKNLRKHPEHSENIRNELYMFILSQNDRSRNEMMRILDFLSDERVYSSTKKLASAPDKLFAASLFSNVRRFKKWIKNWRNLFIF